jgi:putative SOS response-associated peptidase YedK
MCGKFTQLVQWEDVFGFVDPKVVMPDDAPVRYSTPMRSALVTRLGEDGKREQQQMRWGFSKPGQASFKPDHMHARSETVDSRPTFVESFVERRGILVVETFNEGEELPSGKTKQWVFSPKNRKPIAIAIIWEEWEGDDGVVPCFIQLTVPANPLVAKITDRMPAILRAEDWPTWLGETDASLKDVKALLRTFDDAGNWKMAEQEPAKSSKSAKPKPQMDLF